MSRITVEKLGKRYGDAVVLERVDLDVESGSFVAVVGASGCGKSTFLRILLGQEQATTGTVTVDGAPIAPEPTPDRGIVFQRYSVFPHLTALQNLMLVADFRDGGPLARVFGLRRRQAREESLAILERVGLADAAGKYPSELSGGMQQRLAIAQTLLGRPKVLLLDEPFGALDPGIRAEMHALVADIRAENPMTVVMVTHDIAEAFKLGTRILVFAKVRRDPQFPEAYGASIALDRPVRPDAPTHAEDVAAVAALLGVPAH
ncbi:ABC transporter ATP-binding protein [Oharaeibacter diazotrophicus]|uniref:NitT/TauT family transport system ATP-binding protein n=1 Tax=Oharaeibacter diazotrophicus TaxID=1920512 RepID=A0A4R6RKM2_9HYPH|nr:ABC transporter ATP-binding protein [Oharaeibacter diazotrophicus]TDP87211.1 NitT/TauT family transport system ATP-binding protein [Oharaeibacter diazotrophicus]BBE70846.1 glutamine transport ATP-binding protein GlnQ [Pleomorphomonas sp. SM30]GLS77595.1 lauroyl acyltransferase [Oharaeibacter diazotrophicus]